MIVMQDTVGDDEKVNDGNDGNDGKKDDVKEDNEKVEDEQKVENDEKVDDDEKMDEAKVENDEKVDDDDEKMDEAKVENDEKVDDDEKMDEAKVEDGEKVEDERKENDAKVEDVKMEDEAKVEDGEKLDGVAKVDDVEVDLNLKVKDLKVKVKDEKSVDVKAQTNEEIMGGDDNDDNDDFQLYNTPPKGNYGRRVRKPKKDDSYTNPSLSKMPKTKDPMKVYHLQKFEDELLDKVKAWLDDPETDNLTTDEIDAFCHLLRKRISYYPKTYKNSHVAIGDCLLVDRIRREHKTFIKDPANYLVAEFKDYYMASPHRYMPEWSTIDDVHITTNN
ncbi:DEK domain-containing chromatin-associated protein 4-like [Impatiens glandulifera]|uniref:DEK domain-containing chromatin-associated protein 4-like n=1 Tax=Impatiens glandulifera TaxID=253017 RepID=UPI001FB0674A|nr:DEK domain-containing chromatin-associated protein 4-like [Impatiens glandulifera]